jgi:hypothetical protein
MEAGRDATRHRCVPPRHLSTGCSAHRRSVLGDIEDGGLGWYSPDGVHWTEMAPRDNSGSDFGSTLPTNGFGQVVGVSDGFIARGGSPHATCYDGEPCGGGMRYSADGLTRRFLGNEDGGDLLPWDGGALVTSGSDASTSGSRAAPASCRSQRTPGGRSARDRLASRSSRRPIARPSSAGTASPSAPARSPPRWQPHRAAGGTDRRRG